jgi:3-oxoacyl-[acyl-carrier protein] reductase
MRLKDKTAIVTGAGSGFGEAISKRFVLEGARVLMVDINDANGERVAAEIAAQHGEGHAIYQHGDVTAGADVERFVAACLAHFRRIDIMVNNAGISVGSRPMEEVAEADFDRLFAVNVKSLYLSAKHVVPVMRRQQSGVILNTASTASYRPRRNMVWYGGSKGAALTITLAMADELAKDNIRVNAICPVSAETPMVMPNLTPERRAMFEATIPLGRLGKASDVANAALYLASDEADFITGVGFPVDGGRCI